MNWKFQIETFLLASAAGVVLTLLALCFGTILGVKDIPGWLEIGAVGTSFSCTFLFVLQRRQCYLWGFVTTSLYAALFWQFHLPGSAIVQVYLLGALVYGFFRWGRDADTRRVTRVKSWWWLVYILVSGVTWFGAMLISTSYGNPVPMWDSAILALSILAQWLLDNKKLETWGVWVLVNAIAVPLYWSQGLSLVAAEYVFFLGNAVWGYYEWRKSMNPFDVAIRQGRRLSDTLDRDVHYGQDL